MKPQIFLPGNYKQTDINVLKTKADDVIDIYAKQLVELFVIENPSDKGNVAKQKKFVEPFLADEASGAWIYYPWSNKLVHCVGPEQLFRLRTNRNRNLITKEEQTTLSTAVVGIAGMSVGAGIAISLAYSGISKTIKIADHDELDTSNLNRLHESLLSVGQKKIDLAARHIYELDPFSDVIQFVNGVDMTNITDFFENPDLNILVDEIDDFKMKVHLRLAAKEHQIPLIMLTSLGDNILIDVERYDLDHDLKPFNGLIGDIDKDILEQDITDDMVKKLSVSVVGAEYVPTKALASLLEMGKTLVGRPQLYSTIAIDGGLATYVIRNILLGEKVKTGRYFVQFADLIKLNSSELHDTPNRQKILEKLLHGPNSK